MATKNKKVTVREIEQSKSDKIMNVVAERAAYYRSNVHRFVEDYLGIDYLKWFQKILLWAAMKYDAFYFIACRGLGKTYLVALFCVCRCILYPGTKIVVSSYTFKQGKETITKITDDFMHNSAMLRAEIRKTSTGINDCGVWFWNNSSIVVKVAAESSRGARCNCLIIDESRMVSRNIIDTVLVPMLNAPRSPGYLKKKEYQHLQEIGKILQMSSAWYCQSEMFEEVKTYTANMLYDDTSFFICDLPYQVSIESGILMRETIEREMQKQTFNDISFMMEYEGKFYGSSADALFDFKVLNERRTLKDSLHDLDYYRLNGIPIPKKQKNEKRIMSLDVALLASKKHANDASCFTINQAMIVGDTNIISNFTFVETKEGLVTEELGLLAMRYFYQYDIDYFALDSNGIGQSILDYCMSPRYDSLYACTYPAIQTMNDDILNQRCKVKNAPKVIYSIKANARSNNDMILALRAGFQNGNINLLQTEIDVEEELPKLIKGFSKLSDIQQAKIKLPYLQTTLMIEELINLDHDISNGLVKIKEKYGMRKDRVSSIEYNYALVQELLRNMKPKRESGINYSSIFKIRAPKKVTRYK